MESCAVIVKGFQTLSIVAKLSILNLCRKPGQICGKSALIEALNHANSFLDIPTRKNKRDLFNKDITVLLNE